MPYLVVKATFIVVLIFVSTVKTDQVAKADDRFEEVTFSKKDVIVKCKNSRKVYEIDGKDPVTQNGEHKFEYKRPVLYMCKSGEETPYLVYIKGRACENCFELKGTHFLLVILMDLIGTAIVMMIIYRCSKKKTSNIPSKPTKTPPKTGSRGPPVPSPDYESLNVLTRSSETYSTMNTGMVNRTG